ncbi:MAG: adenylate/guanylate cyclase domain-containing protein [candidate division NC10 bacterium]|nr:adenylate/guanylate cyclase domain-containing protein [candidate division NC10 bacterium]
MMKRPWLLGLGIGIVFALIYLSGFLDLPEVRTVDLRFELRGPRPPAFPIVVVSVDDDSLAEINHQWPWPRSYHAKVIEQIASGNPLAIGVDILFPEESRDGEDRLLGQAVARAKRVVLASTLRTMATQTTVGVVQQRELFEPPIPTIRAGAAGIGFVDLERGRDAAVRSGVLARRHAGQVHTGLAKTLFDLVAQEVGAGGSSAARRGRVWINFRGPGGTFPTYPYYQVYRGEIPPRTFEGKIVILGVAALSLHDRHPAPFSGVNWLPSVAGAGPGGQDPEALLMSGSEIQANLLDTILNDDPIQRLPAGVYLVLILALGAAGALLGGHLRPLSAMACSLGLAAAYLVASHLAFSGMNLWIEVVPVVLPLLIASGTTIGVNYIREERVRREYARFFSPVVARQIAEDHSGQALAAKRRRITVLFADIREFTTTSEALPPEEVVELLREYFNTMVPIVLKHGGTLDKYVGDAIMGLFGVPLPDEDHARHAVRAALEMVAQLPVLSPKWEARTGRPLRIGVGVSTGEAVVGIMGADYRHEYSAIGDTVNLASRLEGLTKELKAPVIVSHFTAAEVEGEFQVRQLSELQVKGRQERVRVFAVDGDRREGSTAESRDGRSPSPR